MASGKEIERKFKVAALGLPTPREIIEIEQGFLNEQKERVTRIRVHNDGQSACLTVKGKAEGISRDEIETSIDPIAAKAMLAFCVGANISKTRWLVDHDGMEWSIDFFKGPNAGLVIAEVELTSADQKISLPEWVREEVSLDPRYANSSLCMAPYQSWPPEGALKSAPSPKR